MSQIDDEVDKLRADLADVEKKVQKELDKSLLTLMDSIGRFEKELRGYRLDTIDVTLTLSEKVLGTGTEQEVALTFRKNESGPGSG